MNDREEGRAAKRARWMGHHQGPWRHGRHGLWWHDRRHGRFDVPLAVVIAIVQVLGTHFGARHQVVRRPLDLVGYALLLVGPAALAVRHRRPTTALLVAFGATLAYYQLGYPKGPVFLSLIVAFFTAALHGRRDVAVGILALGFVAFLWLGYVLGTEPAPSLGEVFSLGAWLLVLFAVTQWIRVGRERAAEARRIRQEESRRRSSEERLAMAREIHDVLAHSLSVISVQAGVALHLMDAQPDQARSALTAIKEASKNALRELRSVLGVLRRVDEDAPRSPAPGLARLDELAAGTSAAGIRVETTVEGAPRAVPLAVDLAAFRIVQESLTNVARHAAARTATVHVTYDRASLSVRVEDDGQGPSNSRGGGTGILGMKERAEAVGGELEAGPGPTGGFRVVARFPLEEER